MSPFLQSIVQHTKDTILPIYSYEFLTKANYSVVLKNHTFPPEFTTLGIVQQSDYIRLALLYHYGGWFLQASTLINNLSFFEKLTQEFEDKRVAFSGFCSHSCPRHFIDPGVLYAPPRSSFISAWLTELHEMYHSGLKNYMYYWYRQGIDVSPYIIKSYPKNFEMYFATVVAEQVALQRKVPRRIPMLIRPSRKFIFRLLGDCRWQAKCVAQTLHNETEMQRYPITTFTGSSRCALVPQECKFKIAAPSQETVLFRRSISTLTPDRSYRCVIPYFLYFLTLFFTSWASLFEFRNFSRLRIDSEKFEPNHISSSRILPLHEQVALWIRMLLTCSFLKNISSMQRYAR